MFHITANNSAHRVVIVASLITDVIGDIRPGFQSAETIYSEFK